MSAAPGPGALGPRGTFKMPSLGGLADQREPLGDPLGDPLGEPTPLDPCSFDLSALSTNLQALTLRSLPEFLPPEALAPAAPAQAAQAQAAAAAPAQAAPRAALPAILPAGTQLDAYTVTAHIGSGGFADVYQVSHPTTHTPLALKVLRPEHRDREVIGQKLLAEGRVMKACNGHPGLCVVHEVGEHETVGPFVVMERLQGQTLRSLLDELGAVNKRLSLHGALTLAISVAETAHAMHELGVVHRDLKPENIWLSPKPAGGVRVIVLDWGNAKSHHTAQTTAADVTIATALYAAPEQVRRRTATAAVDQYALAHVLYEMLHEHAFAEGVREHPFQPSLYMIWQATVEPTPLPQESAPLAVWQVLARAFAKEPKERFESMAHLAAALRRLLPATPESAHGADALDAAVVARPAHPDAKPTLMRAGATGGGPEERQRPLPGEVRERKRAVALAEDFEGPTLLVLAPHDLRGQRVELGDRGVIGRGAEGADLMLDHPTVSNRHCRYHYVTGGADNPVYVVDDLGSSNGTAVEGEPILRRSVALRPGERVAFGDVVAVLMPAGSIGPDLRSYRPRAKLPTAPVRSPTAGGRSQEREDFAALGRPSKKSSPRRATGSDLAKGRAEREFASDPWTTAIKVLCVVVALLLLLVVTSYLVDVKALFPQR